MTPFHLISLFALILLVAVCGFGDEIASLIKNVFCFIDPTDRALMELAEEARRTQR